MRTIETSDDIRNGLLRLLDLDPRLAVLAEETGELPLRRRAPTFASLAHIITGQQVSVASASAIFSRLEQRISPLSADSLAAQPDAVLAEIGLSRPKIRTLRALAEACRSGLDLPSLAQRPAEEAHETLCRIKGIGPWTADIFLLFCAGHPDIFPSGDLALRIAIRDAFDLHETPAIKEVDKLALTWRPVRGIAARLFWAWYKTRRSGRDSLPL